MRNDARTNRERILAAARIEVTRLGREATMDGIAAIAEVAVGTLYRHFATKDNLITAVVDDVVDGVARRTETALRACDGGADPADELIALFADVARDHSRNRAVKTAAGLLRPSATTTPTSAPTPNVARALTALTDLLDRAAATHGLRPDLTVADLHTLLDGVPDTATNTSTDATRRDRYIDIVTAGLRRPCAVAAEAGRPSSSRTG